MLGGVGRGRVRGSKGALGPVSTNELLELPVFQIPNASCQLTLDTACVIKRKRIEVVGIGLDREPAEHELKKVRRVRFSEVINNL